MGFWVQSWIKGDKFYFQNSEFLKKIIFDVFRLDINKINTDLIYEHLHHSARSSELEN